MGEETNKQATSGLLTKAQTFIAFTSAVVGVIAAIQALSSKTDADRSAEAASNFKKALEQQADIRAERESRSKFDSVAYEAAVKVLELDRKTVSPEVAEKRERAVLALIISTASEKMQVALFDVIKSDKSVTASVQRDARNASEVLNDVGSLASNAPNTIVPTPKNDATPSSPALSSTILRGYRIVLFYCQNPSNAEVTDFQRTAAKNIITDLKSHTSIASLNIKWETKELPDVLNSAAGYGIKSNEIRFNSLDNEESPSLALKEILESTATVKGYKATFQRRTVNQRTPNYLSVFICGINQEM